MQKTSTQKSKTANCKFHGGLSADPSSREDKDHIRAAHLIHGEETLKAKTERSISSLMFQYLNDIRNHCKPFYREIRI